MRLPAGLALSRGGACTGPLTIVSQGAHLKSSLIDDLALNRRQILGASLAFGSGLALGASPAAAKSAGKLDYSDPRDNLYAFGKIWSGFDTPVIGAFHGLMYLRVPGKRMIPVFGYT